jgi:hypothetical protein
MFWAKKSGKEGEKLLKSRNSAEKRHDIACLDILWQTELRRNRNVRITFGSRWAV